MVAVDIRWLGATYEAGLGGTDPEWPPHPARLFCALVDAAGPDHGSDDALRWMESAGAPLVICSPAIEPAATRGAFVVVNAVDAKGGHQQHPGRRAGWRSWPRCVPRAAGARFVWAADPDPTTAAALAALCRRVPYVGRATSPALVELVDDDAVPAWAGEGGVSSLEVWEPVDAAPDLLRAPRPGYLGELRDAWGEQRRAGDVPCHVPYRLRSDIAESPQPIAGPWSDLVTVGIARGGRGAGMQHALAVTGAFKKAVLQRLGSQFAPDQLAPLHGHHDGTVRQAAFLALPDVGWPHSDGHLLGLGVALPSGMDTDVRRALLRLLVDVPGRDDRLRELWVDRLGELTLEAPRTDGARPQRWCRASAGRQNGRRRGLTERGQAATTWTSVFPVVLDRYPRRAYTAEEAVADGCRLAGFPEPAEVHAFRDPLLSGCRPANAVRRREDVARRPAFHVRVRFESPVIGPVVLGHLRHLGLGLCLPQGGHRDDAAVEAAVASAADPGTGEA